MSLDITLTANRPVAVFAQNITHNLVEMAEAAGLYHYLWRPEEVQVTKAAQLILPLGAGYKLLCNSPEYFKKFNPENGWGDYDDFLNVVSDYLAACKENPDAEISISR